MISVSIFRNVNFLLVDLNSTMNFVISLETLGSSHIAMRGINIVFNDYRHVRLATHPKWLKSKPAWKNFLNFNISSIPILSTIYFFFFFDRKRIERKWFDLNRKYFFSLAFAWTLKNLYVDIILNNWYSIAIYYKVICLHYSTTLFRNLAGKWWKIKS